MLRQNAKVQSSKRAPRASTTRTPAAPATAFVGLSPFEQSAPGCTC